jgi:tRNA modification GTPase
VTGEDFSAAREPRAWPVLISLAERSRAAAEHACATLELAAPVKDPVANNPCALPATVYYWPTSRSYTRAPLAEFHTLGGPAIAALLLERVLACGARLAQPGEFTLRAFLSGRLDLLQAEAVLGVIDAADERQLHAALVQLAGGLSRPLNEIRDILLNLLADLEAGLDFVEEDLAFISPGQIASLLCEARIRLAQLQAKISTDGNQRELPRVVLVGLPNAGKSSLYNALLDRTAALVSPFAGTTRDYLASVCMCDGVEIELLDTAGIEQFGKREQDLAAGGQALASAAQLSAAAQELTAAQAEHAELRVLCLDQSCEWNAWTRAQIAQAQAQPERTLLVATKADLPPVWPKSLEMSRTSASTGEGIRELRTAIAARLQARNGEAVATTAIRCRTSLAGAHAALERAESLNRESAGEELLAAELRAALVELGQIAGAVYPDDLLDRIFSRFCIGK